MVLSMFCMVSARLWMYESCNDVTSQQHLLKGDIVEINKVVCVSSKTELYLLIDELQLQGVGLRVHVDGHVPETPGLILHQH